MRARSLVLAGWLVVGGVGFAVHRSEAGRAAERRDAAAALAAAADALAAAGDEAAAIDKYAEALAALPPDRVADARRLRLAKANAMVFGGQLFDGADDLETLTDELAADPEADPAGLTAARTGLARARYYVAWRKRLEGAAEDDWEPDADAARQGFKLLAERAAAGGDGAAAAGYAADTESAVRLARMDLAELQAQGIPKPVKGKKPGGKPGKKGGKGKKTSNKVGPGAGGESPPDDRGH